MNFPEFYYILILLFNFFISSILAGNDYYIISIRRNSNDEEYDKASVQLQHSIDELVNDRMNDIYDIIADHKETYVGNDGKVDKKLDELEKTLHLKKRNDNKNKVKFKFINNNRPEKQNVVINSVNEKDGLEWIPIESNLVIHICPILNYYVVTAYLSDVVIPKIKKLPNVISCTKSHRFKNKKVIIPRDDGEDKNKTTGNDSSNKYYNKQVILNETKWKDLGVQEHEFSFQFIASHLALLSQDKYNRYSNVPYDFNYYYPSSAGKGIDIYVIDDGLDTSFNEEDFNTYAGTPDERIIQCDGMISAGKKNPPYSEKSCNTNEDKTVFNHGTLVAISAMGTVNGVAKKANLHMVAIDFETFDILIALDHIKQNATPHKTVLNISAGCYNDEEGCEEQAIQDKIDELNDSGIIIIVAAGNTNSDICLTDVFTGAKGVVCVGAIGNDPLDGNEIEDSLENMYRISDYSSFGECLDIFAPGTIRVRNSQTNEIIEEQIGTSFSSPMVAGVAATLMSENPDIEYDFEGMKKKLIDLSIKDVIQDLNDETPNRLLNNGKRIIYGPPRCDDWSGEYHCHDQCCSKFGVCIDSDTEDENLKPLCHVDNECSPEFGYCDKNHCGIEYSNDCYQDECCSKDGECISIFDDPQGQCFIENECLEDYSRICLSKDINNINNYDEIHQNIIYNYYCEKELEPYKEKCTLKNYLNVSSYDEENRNQFCHQLQDSYCTEFFKSPFVNAPTCEKGDQSVFFYNDQVRLAIDRMFCAKKSPLSSNEYCINSPLEIRKVLDEGMDLNSYCSFDECRDSLLNYIKNSYNSTMIIKEELSEYEEGEGEEENDRQIKENKIEYINKTLNILQEKIDFLSSEKCKSSVKTTTFSSTSTPTSTIYGTVAPSNLNDEGDKNLASNLYLYPKYIYYLLLISLILLTLI